MNILVVHEVSYAKKVIYEYQEFAERLAARGHRVTVIDYDEEGGPAYRDRDISRTGAGSVRLRTTPYFDIPLLKYATGRANYPRILRQAVSEGRVDVVLLYSVFINGTATLRICRELGIPVVYRVLDAYHKLRQNPWTQIPLFFGERFIYRAADVVCLTNQKMSGYVDTVAGVPCGSRVKVVEHGVDTELFKPAPRDEALMAEYGIEPTDRVALFVGTLYPFAGLDALLTHAAPLFSRVPNAKIVIVGDGVAMPELRRIVAESELTERVILTGMRPYEEVQRWLSVADVAFNSFRINDVTRDIVPIKTLQYLASGKPVVSAPIPDVIRLFPEREGGIVYRDIESPQRFVDALSELLADPAQARSIGANGRRIIERSHSLDRTIDHLENMLVSVAATAGRVR